MKEFDDYRASGHPLAAPIEKLFQGPMADALIHAGQIAMLRRMAGVADQRRNHDVADISIGRAGADPMPPKKEF